MSPRDARAFDLNRRYAACRSTKAVLALWQREGALDAVNLGTVVSRLGRFGADCGHPTVDAIILSVVERRVDLGPRELSNIAHGCARLRARAATAYVPLGAELLGHQLRPQELSNVLWAAATCGCSLSLMAHLEPSAAGLNPQEISNTLWALATAGHRKLATADRSDPCAVFLSNPSRALYHLSAVV